MGYTDEEVLKQFGGGMSDEQVLSQYGGTPPPVGGIQKTRSGFGEVATGIRSGLTEGVPLQIGQAMQFAGEPTGGGFRQGVYDVGKSIADAAKARQELPENKLQPEKHGAVVNALAEGGQMLAPSIAAPLAVGGGLAALGAASPALAVGAGVGAGISATLGVVPAAMQQGQETLETVRASGASEEVARAAGWKNLAIEGAGEAIGTYAGAKFLGLAGKTIGKAVAPTVAATLAKATDSAIWKPFAKNLVGTAVTEVGTEIGQAGSQAAVEKAAGVDTDPLERMKEVVGPTLGMTALLAPFGLHANYRNAQSAKAVNTILEDPKAATPEQRLAVAEVLHEQAVANKVPDAEQWLTGAKEDIAAGLPIRRVAEVIREEQAPPAAEVDPTTNVVQQGALNGATPEGVSATVEGEMATVTVGDRTVELPVEEAAKAVATGNLEEVLAEKEALPPVEELPAQPFAPTTTFLRQNGETRGYMLPAGKTIEQVREETAEMSPREKLKYFEENKASNYRYKLLDKKAEPVVDTAKERAVYEELRAGRPEFADIDFEDLSPENMQGIKAEVAKREETAIQEDQSVTNDLLYDLANQQQSAQDMADAQKRRVNFEKLQNLSASGQNLSAIPQGEQATPAQAGVTPENISGGNENASVQSNPPAVADANLEQEGSGVLGATEGNIGPVEGPARQGAEPAAAGSKTYDEWQNEIDNETDKLLERYKLGDITDSQVAHEMGNSKDATIPANELNELNRLYRERDAVGNSELDEFVTKVATDSGLDLATATEALGSIRVSQGDFGVYNTSDTLKRWSADITDNLAKLYNHFANGSYAEFRWGGTADNPELEGRAYDDDTLTTGWDAEALKNAEQVYNAVARNVNSSEINLAKIRRTAKSAAQQPPLLSKSQEQPAIRHEGEGVGGHYYTVLDGPAKGTTFVSKTQDPADVQARLEETQARFAPKQAQGDGGSTFVKQVQKELKAFLGSGYDNLVRRGKLEVVRSEADLGEQGEPLRTTSGTIVGSYFPSQKKIYLFSDRLTPGAAADVLTHEAGHALLSEDKLFREQRTKILKDFAILARNNPKIKEAFAKVPADTAKGFRGEEALAYFLQNPENRKHSLFKRVLSAVKAALYRLGIAYGRLSESDLVALFAQGTRAWANRKQDQELGSGRSLEEILSGLGEFAQDPLLSVKEAGRKIQGLAAFKKWFGDSKVVDSEGNPLVVYHGTTEVFNEFAPHVNSKEQLGFGIHLTPDPAFASNYADPEAQGRKKKPGSVIPAYVAAANILEADALVKEGSKEYALAFKLAGRTRPGLFQNDYTDAGEKTGKKIVYLQNAIDAAQPKTAEKLIRESGYDGVWYNSKIIGAVAPGQFVSGGYARSLVVFEPTQIKSIFNQGTWDGKNPDILFSKVSDKLQAGNQEIKKATNILKDVKNPLYDLYVRFAPQWLSVTPISHLAQTFGNQIQWLKNIDKHNGMMEAIKAQLPDDFYAIYQDAERVAKKGAGIEAFNDLLLTGTFNQMTPWKTLTDQDWVPESTAAAPTTEARLKEARKIWNKEMKKSTGKTLDEAFAETKKAWDKLGPAEQAQAKKIVAYLQSLRERERNNLLATIEAASQGNKDLYNEMMDRFNATFSRIRGTYVPLSRYGDYILKFTLPDGREQVDHFNTPGERRAFRKQMEAKGVDPNTMVEDVKRESVKGEAVIPQALREQLMKAMESKYMVGVDQENPQAVAEARGRAMSAVSDLDQVLLRWMPETSALKNSIHRKNVLGASTDMLRSSMDYVLRHAGSIAWMEVGRKIEQDIQNFEEENKELEKNSETAINLDMRGHLLNNVRRWNLAIRNETVGPIASFLGKWSTAYFMTSPSTFLVQLTQLPVLTLPAMAIKYKSLAKATAALAEGLQKAFNKKYSKDAMYGDEKVNEVYAALHRRVTEKDRTGDRQIGEDWFTTAEKLAKIAELRKYQKELLALREALAMNMLDISAVHEASDIAQGKQTTYFGKAMRYAMLPMQHGELGSRKATVLANFKLATEQKKDFFTALEDANEVVGGTLYNYAKSDKGWAMQGGVARTLTTFQTYRIKTALRMGILLMQSLKGETKEVRRSALKEFIGVTGMSAALAGVHGTVIGGLVFGLANLFGGDDDEPYDAELEFNNWLKENFGETAGAAASYGLPTLLGTNLSKRIGMGDLYGTQSEPPSNLHGAGLAAWWAGNLIGPSFSVAQSWVKGYDQMFNKGNYMRGLEEALPKPLKDGLKAYRVATEGLKTGAGKKLISDDQIGPDEIVMMALGFNPDEVAKAQGAERSLTKLGTKLTERRGRLIKDAARAIVESEDTTDALEAIRVFNSKLPLFAIRGSDIKPAVRKLVLGEMGTTGVRQRQVASQFGIETYSGE